MLKLIINDFEVTNNFHQRNDMRNLEQQERVYLIKESYRINI